VVRRLHFRLKAYLFAGRIMFNRRATAPVLNQKNIVIRECLLA